MRNKLTRDQHCVLFFVRWENLECLMYICIGYACGWVLDWYYFNTEINECQPCITLCSVPILLISLLPDKHISSCPPPLLYRSSSKAGQVWAPEGSTAFKCLVSARFCAALLSNISDCDETYNYWEPVSYSFSWFTVFGKLSGYSNKDGPGPVWPVLGQLMELSLVLWFQRHILSTSYVLLCVFAHFAWTWSSVINSLLLLQFCWF